MKIVNWKNWSTISQSLAWRYTLIIFKNFFHDFFFVLIVEHPNVTNFTFTLRDETSDIRNFDEASCLSVFLHLTYLFLYCQSLASMCFYMNTLSYFILSLSYLCLSTSKYTISLFIVTLLSLCDSTPTLALSCCLSLYLYILHFYVRLSLSLSSMSTSTSLLSFPTFLSIFLTDSASKWKSIGWCNNKSMRVCAFEKHEKNSIGKRESERPSQTWERF
jgi:hypothetical protein